MKKIAFLLIILSILTKLIGLGREITLSYFYGTSSISDAYLIALIIPTVFFDFLGVAIATGFIPMYNTIEKEQGLKKADNYTSNLINILLIISTLIIIIAILFSEKLVGIFAPGFDEQTFLLAVSFTKISIFSIYFTILVYLMRSFLQNKGSYTIPALVSLPMNIIIIFSIYLSHSLEHTLILPIGLLFGIISQFIFLIPSMLKIQFNYRIYFNIKDPYIKKMFYLAIPIFLSVAVNDINKIVDKSLASKIESGGISALSYAGTLNNVVQGVFVLSIATAMYPLISKLAIEANINKLKSTVLEAISIINLLVIPVTVGIMFFTEPIITLLFGNGAFNTKSIDLTSNALFYYSIGMVGFGIREVLSRPFYAMQNTLIPMVNASIGVIINIILNFILSRYMGIGGLALATSVSGFITSLLLYVSLRKKIGSLEIRKVSISFMKIVLASLAMGLLAKILYNNLLSYCDENLSLIIAILIGVIFYFSIISFLKIEDFDKLLILLKGKIRK